jgi:amino acid permease
MRRAMRVHRYSHPVGVGGGWLGFVVITALLFTFMCCASALLLNCHPRYGGVQSVHTTVDSLGSLVLESRP